MVAIRNSRLAMRCPTLSELPAPLPGKTGWPFDYAQGWQDRPWTEEPPRLPDTMASPSATLRAGGSSWPRVTIVTPSYNQGQFIEKTIRSVLLQDYPDLEYIIIDGGSTDGSVDIIRKYEHHLAYWVSEPDWGQAHAVNKGWQRATGSILGWLNSDDMYTSGAVRQAVEALEVNPQVGMVYSDFDSLDERTGKLERRKAYQRDFAAMLADGNCIPQPTAFLRRNLLEQIGLLDESLHICLDYEFWLRARKVTVPLYLKGTSLAILRVHKDAKGQTQHDRFGRELLSLLDRVFSDPQLPPGARRASKAAYARAYWICAYGAVSQGRGYPEGANWLIRSLMAHPRPVMLRPLMTVRMVGTIIRAAINGL